MSDSLGLCWPVMRELWMLLFLGSIVFAGECVCKSLIDAPPGERVSWECLGRGCAQLFFFWAPFVICGFVMWDPDRACPVIQEVLVSIEDM